jgi:Transposase
MPAASRASSAAHSGVAALVPPFPLWDLPAYEDHFVEGRPASAETSGTTRPSMAPEFNEATFTVLHAGRSNTMLTPPPVEPPPIARSPGCSHYTTFLGWFESSSWVPPTANTLDLEAARDFTRVAAWLRSQPHHMRENLDYGCLVMSRTYNAVFQVVTPKVTRVIDRFHGTRHTIATVDAVRRRVQQQRTGTEDGATTCSTALASS